MDSQTIIAITAIVVSGAVGVAGVVLNFRSFMGADIVGRAVRRTMALQMLSDEEFALRQVEEECRSIELLIHSNREQLGDTFDHLQSESSRIVGESIELLRAVKQKRMAIKDRIRELPSDEIEAVIAQAYHGKMLAEAQRHRTMRSREDTIRIYLS